MLLFQIINKKKSSIQKLIRDVLCQSCTKCKRCFPFLDNRSSRSFGFYTLAIRITNLGNIGPGEVIFHLYFSKTLLLMVFTTYHEILFLPIRNCVSILWITLAGYVKCKKISLNISSEPLGLQSVTQRTLSIRLHTYGLEIFNLPQKNEAN